MQSPIAPLDRELGKLALFFNRIFSHVFFA